VSEPSEVAKQLAEEYTDDPGVIAELTPYFQRALDAAAAEYPLRAVERLTRELDEQKNLVHKYNVASYQKQKRIDALTRERNKLLEGLENLGWPCRLEELPDYVSRLTRELREQSERRVRAETALIEEQKYRERDAVASDNALQKAEADDRVVREERKALREIIQREGCTDHRRHILMALAARDKELSK